MAYQITAENLKLDPFTLRMMTDVLTAHAAKKSDDHESGFCCQVAVQYKSRVDAHNAVVAEETKALKANPASVDRPYSEPQVRYITALYKKCPQHLISPAMREQAERVVKHEPVSFEVASALIEAMKSVVDGPVREKQDGEVRYATAPQVGYLRKLLAERENNEKVDILALEALPFQAASDMITRLRQAAYKVDSPEAKRRAYVPEEGLYEVDGTVYKVQLAKANGSGKAYAKIMDGKTGRFDYVGKQPFPILTADKRMSREEAGAYGKLYGICIRCGRELTDEFSISEGMGKICYEKMGG